MRVALTSQTTNWIWTSPRVVATYPGRETFPPHVEAIMRKQRKPETAEERNERLKREAHRKVEDAAAAEAAVDQMIRKNIRQYGP